ncbi:MAG: hypothetical protein GFH27_549395n62 [Chloroflexi bacterium AL-W]|nr:hypothetical protein [Chloroflexi bacterium AL-W]
MTDDKPQPKTRQYSAGQPTHIIKPPLPNYTLSSVCPNCDAPTVRRACKVRCNQCGFMWDCSEL